MMSKVYNIIEQKPLGGRNVVHAPCFADVGNVGGTFIVASTQVNSKRGGQHTYNDATHALAEM